MAGDRLVMFGDDVTWLNGINCAEGVLAIVTVDQETTKCLFTPEFLRDYFGLSSRDGAELMEAFATNRASLGPLVVRLFKGAPREPIQLPRGNTIQGIIVRPAKAAGA